MDATLSIRVLPFGRDGLRVQVAGARSFDNTIAYWTRIAEQVVRQSPRLLLLIDDLDGSDLTPREWHGVVEAMAGCGLERVRIAHVKRDGLDHLEYCEIYANAAGLDARAFDDEREAERWLRYGEGAADSASLPPRRNR
jgi:hypothetical protein